MKYLSGAILMSFLVGVAAHAQGKTDFSGTWKMDSTRSQSAVQNEPIGPVTVVIAQTPTEITIETQRAPKPSTLTYRLDNSVNKLPDGTATTHWDGTTLVTDMVRTINGQTVTTRESRSLNADGTEMLVDTVLVVQHGYSLKGTQNYGAGKDVYTRVRQ